MKKYIVDIKGVSPAIQNRLSRELNKQIKEVPKDKKEEWEDKNYKKKLYTKGVESKELVYWPSLNIHGMLLDGCKKYKVPPPTSIGRTWTTYFKSCVIIEEDSIMVHDGVKPFEMMVSGNPSSSAKSSSKVYRVRPMMNNWQTTLYIMDTNDFLNKDIVKAIVETAGKFVGLSDFRPQYGRFIVTKVEEVDLE